MKIPQLAVALLAVVCANLSAQTSIWPSSSIPGTPQATNDTNSVTLGLSFYSDVPGTVTGVRFYKGPNNTGTHVGTLWSGSGAVLGQVTFSGETASGWQQATFSSPISIPAKTPYVISYLAPNGNYAQDQYYSWSSVNTSPLHVSGSASGVFAYGSSTAFPSSTWHDSNYWVDVVFAPATTTTGASVGQTSLWPSSATPQVPQATNDSSSVTLGVMFYSDVPGTVTGVRFYKGSNNTGTHVGSLWSSTGALLGQVTFANETASGWQQATFSSPISITATTPYVISYLAPNGSYAQDQYYSWSTLSTSPLHVSGSTPGVFAYGSSPAFPSGSWHSCNYWVDVAFTPASAPGSSTYSITGNVSGAAATLALSGPVSASATTGAGANYTFSGLPNGTYRITPSQAGVTFTPATATVSISNGSISGVNFTGTTATSTLQHSVTVGWNASSSPNVVGYNVYRGTQGGGPYMRVNTALVSGTGYTDNTVTSGGSYYYVVTAVNSDNEESGDSNVAPAAVPTP